MLRDLLKTDDMVVQSFAVSMLRDAGIATVVRDEHLSQLHGAVGLVPRRIAVESDDWAAARLRLIEAGLGAWVLESEDE